MRTNSMRSFTWLKRVGLNQVSNDWRLIFFSRAPRIRTHGLSTVVGVVTKDIPVPCLIARGPSKSGQKGNAQITLGPKREAPGHFSLAGRCIGMMWLRCFGRSTDTREASGNSLLIDADTSTISWPRGCGFCSFFSKVMWLHQRL